MRSVSSLLPDPLSLPPVLADLFDWIDERGWSRPGDNGSSWIGSPYPLDRWPVDGTMVMFEVESRHLREQRIASYLGVPGYGDRLVPFARTGHDGSCAAFWIDDDGDQHIVHLGSGSGSVLTCRLGRAPEDFVRLLAVGYPQICWLDAESYQLTPQDVTRSLDTRSLDADQPFTGVVNRPLHDWVTRQGMAVPKTAAQVMGRPAFMDDGPHSHDSFCRWLAEVSG